MHSTKTAVLKVVADILLALDSGDLAMLTQLDLSAAFDSVDHDTLLNRLQKSNGLSGQVLDCMVRLIFVWPCSTRTHIGGLLYTVSGSVRSTAGIAPRANPIPSVHR